MTQVNRSGEQAVSLRAGRSLTNRLVCSMLVGVSLASATLLAQAAPFKLSIVDRSGKRLPCRVLVKAEDGTCFVPQAATTLQTGRDLWFVSSGQTKVDVTSGRVLLRVERGLEFVRFKGWIDVTESGATKTVHLRRWVHMKERGYLTGENHLHIDSKQLAPMLAAEGLDFGTSLTWWRGPDARRPIPPGSGKSRRLTFAGHTTPTSIYDAELEYAWGAAYIQNLPAPLPLKAEPGRPNLDYLKHAVKRGAIVHYQGGWSREVLLDALLGCVHTVNVCNNNFALHRFQPRSRYSNLLNVEGFPTYPDTDVGMLKMNTATYYRLLNCGLRLAAGAGSATGVKAAPVGYNRAYVRVAEDASIEEFYRAWKRGSNFVTNGPILQLSTASNRRPGDTIKLSPSGGTIDVRLEVVSDQPLQTVQLVVNGEVIEAFDIKGPKRVEVTRKVTVESGSWIVARCTARDGWLTDKELTPYDGRGTRDPFGVARSRLRFAHSSPIYVTVGGRGPLVRRSVEEGLVMLDRFDDFATATAAPAFQSSIQAALAAARDKLKRRLRASE